MGLVQAREHLAHHRAHGVHAVGSFNLWLELVVNRLPIQTARVGLPVLVADRRPHILKGLEAELALLPSKLGAHRIGG